MSFVSPCRAPVRPRVISPITGDAVLLEDEIADLLQSRSPCLVALEGPRCSGKTTALRHLAAVVQHDRLLVLDDDEPPPAFWRASYKVLVHVPQHEYSPDLLFEMAPWSDDDVLEYLLATSPTRTASVLNRWRNSTDHHLASDSPELIRWILDQMIGDDSIDSVRQALLSLFRKFLPDPDEFRRAGMFALATILGLESEAIKLSADVKERLNPEFLRLLNLEGTRLVLAALHVLNSIPEREKVLQSVFPQILLTECGVHFQDIPDLERHLQRILDGKANPSQATAASILHAAGRPVDIRKGHTYLVRASLSGINWIGAKLSYARMEVADLSGADLSQADLERASLKDANLSDACLKGASIWSANGTGANLTNANLVEAILRESNWEYAKFILANLQSARLDSADLRFADFRGADLRRAILRSAKLIGSAVEDADFRDADLSRAILSGLPLREAQINGAKFEEANLERCDLECVQLEKPIFIAAQLKRALLTGSIMEAPNFHCADLRETGLADIQWPNANLRNADLRGASFHLGSTRCGLVDSPYPSHGTRTGFYTNDYDEQNYRAPEEIRKADLRGADLRGANIFGVDFYLVDLRGAHYDDEQRDHLIQCDAILHDRPPN